ncbi:MAG: hypothetical protein EBZ36_11760 [Acidobacteria bacterium]|nr:hypothetical protein [Acidobacteriota bacterium]
MFISPIAPIILILITSGLLVTTSQTESAAEATRRIFRQLDRDASWELVATVPLRFNAHHPQGMVRVGEDLFLSAVEVTRATRSWQRPAGRFDRDEGAGIGHLFRFNMRGELLADLRIGEGSIYHPGGIDYDGRHIWIPVAEYRPNSRSIIYRVEPAGLRVEEVCRFDDHLGGIVHQTEKRRLAGLSWGARRLYWLNGCRLRSESTATARLINPSFYIDYQDCHYLGQGEILCGGLRRYFDRLRNSGLSLGGLELVDIATARPIHQIPVDIWSESGHPLTRNPFWIEPQASGESLRGFFIPDDGESALLVYDIRPVRRPDAPQRAATGKPGRVIR